MLTQWSIGGAWTSVCRFVCLLTRNPINNRFHTSVPRFASRFRFRYCRFQQMRGLLLHNFLRMIQATSRFCFSRHVQIQRLTTLICIDAKTVSCLPMISSNQYYTPARRNRGYKNLLALHALLLV